MASVPRYCVVAFGAALACAQEAASIDGLILDESTRAPLPGARVILRYETAHSTLQTATADANGSFHFSISEPGSYAVESEPENYIAHSEAVRIDDAPSTHAVTLTLSRSAVIMGRVRDGGTEKPLPRLTVTALRLRYLRGERQYIEERIAFADAEGNFLLPGLQPGEYYLEIKKSPSGGILAGRQADFNEANQPPRLYPQTIWPGGGLRDADPVMVRAGDEMDLGNLDLRQVEAGRIRGNLAHEGCSEGQDYLLSIQQRFGSRVMDKREQDFGCNQPFTIPNLSPGDYRIRASAFVTTALAAFAEIKVAPGSDLDLTLTPTGAVISGKIVYQCLEDCSEVEKVQQVNLTPAIPDPYAYPSGGKVDEQGAFQLLVLYPGAMRLAVEPSPKQFFIRQVLYNGADVGTTFAPDTSASGQMEIILSDQPARLTGTVLKDGKPATGTHVLLAPWPLRPPAGWPAYQATAADGNGGFAFQTLVPGKYHVLSLEAKEWDQKDLPGRLIGWLSAADEIELAPKESRAIVLK
jgi:hypothetical protein